MQLGVPEGRHNVAHRASGGKMVQKRPYNPGRGDTRVRAVLAARHKMELSNMKLAHYWMIGQSEIRGWHAPLLIVVALASRRRL